jgi:hypothetical protein
MLFISLNSFIMYECILILIMCCSHYGSTIFVGVGFSYALRLKVRRSTTRPHVELDVDRPFINGGQLMCHEVFICVEDIIGSTWVSDTPALKFL